MISRDAGISSSGERSTNSAVEGHFPPMDSTTRPRPAWWRYGMAMLAVGLAVLLRMALVPIMGLNVPYVTLFPAMMIGAVMFGALPGVVATIVGILLAEVLFIEPVGNVELTMS